MGTPAGWQGHMEPHGAQLLTVPAWPQHSSLCLSWPWPAPSLHTLLSPLLGLQVGTKGNSRGPAGVQNSPSSSLPFCSSGKARKDIRPLSGYGRNTGTPSPGAAALPWLQGLTHGQAREELLVGGLAGGRGKSAEGLCSPSAAESDSRTVLNGAQSYLPLQG